MTQNEMNRLNNGDVLVELERGFHVAMHILDRKMAWGKLRLKVTPVKGVGEAWIDTAMRKVTNIETGERL